MSASSRISVVSRTKVGAGRGCMWMFFLPFLLIGLGIFAGLTVVPGLKVLAAREWQKIPCVVDSSRVVAHSDGDGTTYSIEVVYRYFFAGREYTSNRYNFSIGSTGTHKSKDRIVAGFPAGTEAFCYINPAAPQEAVIERGWQAEMAFGGLGLIFAAAGIFGFVVSIRTPGGKKTSTWAKELEAGSSGPVTLKPSYSPVKKFLTVLAFAVFWNGFISIFVYLVFFADDAKQAPFFAKAIVSLFGLIGVVLIIGVLGDFVALFKPRTKTPEREEVPLPRTKII